MMYTLENVTENIEAWFNKDPVRPELNVEFKTKDGREVYALKDEDGSFKAFLCLAYVTDVPTNTEELDLLTSIDGHIAVPYTVWSYQRGAGKEIINRVLDMAKNDLSTKRVITLSPLTKMARDFHIRNKAVEIRTNKSTVNFEYTLEENCIEK